MQQKIAAESRSIPCPVSCPMHMLHTYLASNLEKKISASQVVVWYDPRKEFVSFIRELAPDGEGSTQNPQYG
jgi:hypothetical protein